MADIFIRALPKYAPDLIVLLGLYLLLLGRWKKARSAAGAGVHGVQRVYAGRAVGDGAAGALHAGDTPCLRAHEPGAVP